MGLEPDIAVPPAVVAGLAAEGIDVDGYLPRRIDPELLTDAIHVVTFGCELPPMEPHLPSIEQWNDLPMVSDGYPTARDAILARVEQLLDTYAREARSTFRNTEAV